MPNERPTPPPSDSVPPQAVAAGPKPGGNGAAGNGDERIDDVPIYRKKRVIIPFVLLIAAVAFGGWYWYTKLKDYVSTDDAFLDADRVAISAKVLGRIVKLSADEGSAVKKGDLLVQLDETDLRAQVEQARSALALAQDSLPLSKVAVARATDDFARAETQFKAAIVTKEQYVHAQEALDAARAEFAVAQSRIAVARTQLAVVETQLLNMTLSAPFDGVVAKRWLMEGDVVQPGQAVFTIYDTGRIWVTAYLEETKLAALKIGETVEVAVDAYPDRRFAGRITSIGDYAASQFSLIPPNNASGNFTKITQRVPVKIFFDGLTAGARKDFPLRPGMSVEIRIKVR